MERVAPTSFRDEPQKNFETSESACNNPRNFGHQLTDQLSVLSAAAGGPDARFSLFFREASMKALSSVLLRRSPIARRRLRNLLIERFEDRALMAIDFEPVLDINTNSAGSSPTDFTQVGSTLFFTATTELGTELWKTDGTVLGTQLVKDVLPGSGSSNPSSLTVVGSTLFFRASTAQGSELWKSDGTSAGTVLVKDIRPGLSGSAPTDLVNGNGTLFFRANDGSTGYELWKSDGTDSGTVLVKDINPGVASSGVTTPANIGGVLVFGANDGTEGSELWRSDGTTAGTVRMVTIRPGALGSSPDYFRTVGGFVYFSANDGSSGIELWRTGGTAGSTNLVSNINPGLGNSYPSNFTNVNGLVYFTAFGAAGKELWKTDGTNAGTTQVKDILGGVYSSNPYRLTNISGTLYFQANDGISGAELWKSDGSPAGTVLVSDTLPGSGSGGARDIVPFAGGIYFVTQSTAGSSRGLWRTNGSTTATLIKHTIPSGGSMFDLTPFAGGLFFSASDSLNSSELWRSDGSSLGTTFFKDLNPATQPSSPSLLGQIGDLALFTATTGSNRALWATDGSTAGTIMIKDINGAGAGLSIVYPVNVNGTIYFSAHDGTTGLELWKSDGTANGTVRVKDIAPGSASSYPGNLTNVNGVLYFAANHPTFGTELWRSDGTEIGTVLVKDINLNYPSSSPARLTNVNGWLFFSANDGTNGAELWRSDGTPAGTSMVKNINAGQGSNPSNLHNADGKLYFRASDGINGYELWGSDGTNAGTFQIANIRSGAASSYPSDFTQLGSKAYFVATGPEGRELWATDGTPLGTAIVKDILPGTNGSSPADLMVFNNALYFSAASSTGDGELWRSNGTSVGTVQITDINTNGGSSIGELTSVGDNLIFNASNGLISRAYVSNGTTLGTIPLISNGTLPTQVDTGIFMAISGKLYSTGGEEFMRVRSNVDIDLSTGANNRSIIVRKTSLGIEVFDQTSSTQLALISNLAMASVQSLTILGTDGFNEAITIDYQSGGFFSFPAGIHVSGGTSSADTLTIVGNSSQRLQWQTQTLGGLASYNVLQPGANSAGSVIGVDTINTSGFLTTTGVGLLHAGPPNMFFNNPGTLTLAASTVLGGGTLSTTSLASLTAGSVLSGSGNLFGRFTGELGSLIIADGNLALGLDTSGSGFITRGDLSVGRNSVSLLDANEAVLGSQTSLGAGETPGSLTAANGLLVDFGNNVNGFGSINTPNLATKPFTMNGSLAGVSSSSTLTVTGYLKGVGSLTNVTIAGTYSPGFSPAAVTVGSLQYAPTSTTLIEIGGTTAGTGHDQINHLGAAQLGGTLSVQLINGFTPTVGNSFLIMTSAAGFSSDFATQLLPTPPLGTGWHIERTSQMLRLDLVDLANVSTTRFGDGTPQHSRIDQLAVTFQGQVDIDAGAFGLLKRGAGGGLVTSNFTTAVNGSGDTVATLSFSGAFTRAGGALLDGYYQLTIDSTKVRRAGTQLALDGDANGLAGGDFVRGTSATDSFFAYYGDTNGDGAVGVAEFGQFRTTFGKLPADPGYNLLFDYDGSGVGVGDFGQFRTRFGRTIPFE